MDFSTWIVSGLVIVVGTIWVIVFNADLLVDFRGLPAGSLVDLTNNGGANAVSVEVTHVDAVDWRGQLRQQVLLALEPAVRQTAEDGDPLRGPVGGGVQLELERGIDRPFVRLRPPRGRTLCRAVMSSRTRVHRWPGASSRRRLVMHESSCSVRCIRQPAHSSRKAFDPCALRVRPVDELAKPAALLA